MFEADDRRRVGGVPIEMRRDSSDSAV